MKDNNKSPRKLDVSEAIKSTIKHTIRCNYTNVLTNKAKLLPIKDNPFINSVNKTKE